MNILNKKERQYIIKSSISKDGEKIEDYKVILEPGVFNFIDDVVYDKLKDNWYFIELLDCGCIDVSRGAEALAKKTASDGRPSKKIKETVKEIDPMDV